MKNLFVLIFSYLNGFILMSNIKYARKGFKSIYDKQRIGFLVYISNGIGITLGGLFTYLW